MSAPKQSLSVPTPVTAYGGDIVERKAVIAASASITDAIDLKTNRLACIQMPSSWTAANLTFQVSSDGETYADLYDAFGSEYTVTADASQALLVDVKDFFGFRFLKIRSGTSGTPVNQAAGRELKLICVR